MKIIVNSGKVAFAALLFTMCASGALIQDTPPFVDLTGTGLGAVSTVLTMNSPSNTSNSSGCSYYNGTTSVTGTGCPVGGFGGDELAINNTFTLMQLGITNFADLRILYNSSEPGNSAENGVTLDDLRLLIQNPTGMLLHVESLAASVVYPSVANGTGNSAFAFRIDDATTANLFLNPNNRIGIAAKASMETGGNETFFTATTVIPEPGTFGLAGGIFLLAFGIRRFRLKA